MNGAEGVRKWEKRIVFFIFFSCFGSFFLHFCTFLSRFYFFFTRFAMFADFPLRLNELYETVKEIVKNQK